MPRVEAHSTGSNPVTFLAPPTWPNKHFLGMALTGLNAMINFTGSPFMVIAL